MDKIPYLRNLRRQCTYQRAKGTKADNGYPYGEHLQDCDICQAAEYIEQLQADKERLIDNIMCCSGPCGNTVEDLLPPPPEDKT